MGSLSAQLLSSLIASVADESGDAENKKENDYRNPRTDGDPFHYAGNLSNSAFCVSVSASTAFCAIKSTVCVLPS